MNECRGTWKWFGKSEGLADKGHAPAPPAQPAHWEIHMQRYLLRAPLASGGPTLAARILSLCNPSTPRAHPTRSLLDPRPGAGPQQPQYDRLQPRLELMTTREALEPRAITVLVIDSNPGSRGATLRLLEECGYKVRPGGGACRAAKPCNCFRLTERAHDCRRRWPVRAARRRWSSSMRMCRPQAAPASTSCSRTTPRQPPMPCASCTGCAGRPWRSPECFLLVRLPPSSLCLAWRVAGPVDAGRKGWAPCCGPQARFRPTYLALRAPWA